MNKSHRMVMTVGVALLVMPVGFSAAQQPEGPANNILARHYAIERAQPEAALRVQQVKALPAVSGGVMTALREALVRPAGDDAVGVFGALSTTDAATAPPSGKSNGCPNVFKGNDGAPDNIRVNQDCTLRRQAEEWVGVNPSTPEVVGVTARLQECARRSERLARRLQSLWLRLVARSRPEMGRYGDLSAAVLPGTLRSN